LKIANFKAISLFIALKVTYYLTNIYGRFELSEAERCGSQGVELG